MDGSELDYQPRKRIRLESTSASTLLSDKLSRIDDDDDDEDRDQGIYTHALPRVNLEGVCIQSSIPASATCSPLTPSQLAKSTTLDHEIATKSSCNISHSRSVFAAAETFSGFNEPLCTGELTDQVCFGMVRSRSSIAVLASFHVAGYFFVHYAVSHPWSPATFQHDIFLHSLYSEKGSVLGPAKMTKEQLA